MTAEEKLREKEETKDEKEDEKVNETKKSKTNIFADEEDEDFKKQFEN